MLFEASTIASVVSVFIEAMEKNYGFDLRPALEDLGIDLDRLTVPGARYPDALFDDIWRVILEKTGDDCAGLVVGRHVRATTFHALGYAWLASETLAGAFRRLARFDRIISTADRIEVQECENHTTLTLSVRTPELAYIPASVDAYFSAIMKLCEWVTDSHIAPLEVRLRHSSYDRALDFVTAFHAPVTFDAAADQLIFDRALVDAALSGQHTELASLHDRVAERYLETLDPKIVASKVRELLLKLLPSGDATVDRVAARMACSTSTLQRRLHDEGATFAELRDETRKAMAMNYLRDSQLSLTEIAFLVGFSDPSNFSRAFRRWTGRSPMQWRDSV